MWSFDYRLIWFQWGLHHFWYWCKIRWPAQSHGKSLARLEQTPCFLTLWFHRLPGNSFWLHISQRAVKGRWEWKDPQEKEVIIYTQLEQGGGRQTGNVQPLALEVSQSNIFLVWSGGFQITAYTQMKFLCNWKSTLSCPQVGRNCSRSS